MVVKSLPKHMKDVANIAKYLWPIGLLIWWFAAGISCANQGLGPGGGDRDTIPPIVIRSIPAPYQTNVKGNQIEVIFNEFVVPDKLNEKLVISPPLAQRPSIKIKGKGIVIQINEDLIPDRTYSIDFKDGIKDFNEGNKLESFRMIFSTSDDLDTLRISGTLLDAFTLSPIDNAVLSVYTFDNDTIFSKLRPDFIARTNAEGNFLFDNLPQGEFMLYALTDIDNNLMYTQPTETIAFMDSMLHTNAQFVAKIDTLFQNGDTIISTGYTDFYPEPVSMLMFSEKKTNRYLNSFKRPERDRITFLFSEAVCDSFSLKPIAYSDSVSWNYTEMSQGKDTIELWLTQTELIKIDTLLMAVNYMKSERDGTLNMTNDTIRLVYNEPKTRKAKAPVEDDSEEADSLTVKLFPVNSNLRANDFDLDLPIIVEFQLPIDSLPSDGISLAVFINDSTTSPLAFKIESVNQSKRKFMIDFKPNENTQYELSIDSAFVFSLAGIPNAPYKTTFKTRSKDYYGSVIINIEGFDGEGIAYLLRNNDKEDIVDTLHIRPNSKIFTFEYVKPEKYRIKLLDDRNGDGQWTTGDLKLRRQPERVYYFDKILKVRSNWESKENWIIDPNQILPKVLTDEDGEKK